MYDKEVSEEAIKRLNRSKLSFVKGTREYLLDVEMKRADNCCEFITKKILKICSSTGGEMFEFEHRKKTRKSLDEKYQNTKMSNEDPGDNGLNNILALEKALNNIHDNVRYTLVYNFDEYVEKYFEVQSLLKSYGFKTVRVKNTWLMKNSYKGINTIVECYNDEKGKNYLFELQFHNEISTNSKDKTHSLYEISRDEINHTKEERDEADKKRAEIFNSMPIPNDIEKIINFDNTK